MDLGVSYIFFITNRLLILTEMVKNYNFDATFLITNFLMFTFTLAVYYPWQNV